MILTWVAHGTITALIGLIGLIGGGPIWVIAAATCYLFREFAQHESHGTHGFLELVDRLGDAGVPIGVALLYGMLL